MSLFRVEQDKGPPKVHCFASTNNDMVYVVEGK